jgi:ADP-ribose pyrophosphatase YjhB (NUDIX family)
LSARSIRIAAKAVIVRGGHLLVIVKRDAEGEYFILPGGGQEPCEALDAAVRRECLEELGVAVDVGDLLCVRDYIAANHEFADQQANAHQLELMFACQVPDDYTPRMGHVPDEGQEGVRWLPLRELETARLYPAALKQVLAASTNGRRYLGDVN